MGYPDQHIHYFRLSLCTCLVLLLAICFPVMDGFAEPSRAPSGLPPGDWDHVIITDQSLKPAFVPLAKHRKNQGLRCRILSTDVIGKWARQDDPMEAIRWFISTASQEWGTRYVLLGGDSGIIPIPLGFFEAPNFSWEIPLDLYYAAPGGDWDLDGDGVLGEIGDDAPDLSPAVALGRAPVSDRDEVRTFVKKVIAFENESPAENHDVLLAAEVGMPHPWHPGMDVFFDFAWKTEEVAEVLAGMGSVGDIQRLYQNPDGSPFAEPLTPGSFLDALRFGRFRFLGMIVRGIADSWSLGPDYLSPVQVEGLEEMDHSFFLVAGIPEAADFRGESVLETFLTLPNGGCAGALAPSSLYFLAPASIFIREFWQSLVAGKCDRVGDAYRQVLVSQILRYGTNSATSLATLQCLSIVGDPALLFMPTGGREMKPVRNIQPGLTATASPNPFNPTTEISFSMPGEMGAKVSTGVEIFDLGGRRIARIMDAVLSPGTHSVRWNGEDDAGRKVGSGLFFARIRAGGFQTVVKLVLVE